MEEKRTVRVTGRGVLKLRPDLTRLTLTLQGTDMDYDETLRRSAEEAEALRGVLAELGFPWEALKTLEFSVDTLYEGYQDEKGVYRNRFAGYQFRHELKLDFPVDSDLLGRTLYALAHSDAKPEMRISYTLSDPEAAKNALLAAAVSDARAKAEALCAAAGETLGPLLHIDYARSEPALEVRPMRKLMAADNCAAESAAYDMGIEPDDLSVADTVTMLWALGGPGRV
jgi:hypothetical protein